MSAVIIHQIIIFFAVMLVGCLAGKFGIIRNEFLPDLARLLTKILLPALCFYVSYCGVTAKLIVDNAAVIALAIGFYALIAVSMHLLSKLLHLSSDKSNIFQLAFVFGNTGFVGMPLLLAIFPKIGGVYLALFSIPDQLLFWTYGVYLATASGKKADIKAKSFLNPNVIAIFLALAFATLGIKLPTVAVDVLRTIKDASCAVSLLYLGALFYFSDWKSAFKTKELYFGICFKMLIVPVILGLVLKQTALPQSMIFSMIILMSLPTMTVVPMVAEMRGSNGAYATGITVATLAASIVTIPLVAMLVM